jgi:hypothetical protein
MKIAIGSDHAGFRYKEKIKQFLAAISAQIPKNRLIIRFLFVRSPSRSRAAKRSGELS